MRQNLVTGVFAPLFLMVLVGSAIFFSKGNESGSSSDSPLEFQAREALSDFSRGISAPGEIQLPQVPHSNWLFRPIEEAQMTLECGIAEGFSPALRSVVRELAAMQFNDNFTGMVGRVGELASDGDMDALAFLGELHRNHLVDETRNTEAADRRSLNLLEKAHEGGSDIGTYFLASAYDEDELVGLPDSESTGHRLRELTGENNWQKSTGFLLKNIYVRNSVNGYYGFEDVEITQDEAENFHRAALQSCDTPLTGLLYADFMATAFGMLNPEVRAEVTELLTRYSDRSAEANISLGVLYDSGSLTISDYNVFYEPYIDEALGNDYFLKAASQGHPSAMWNLYYAYSGDGVAETQAFAEEMLIAAASFNDDDAVRELSRLYATGSLFYEKDLERAALYAKHLSDYLSSYAGVYGTRDAILDMLSFVAAEERPSQEVIQVAVSLSEDLVELLEASGDIRDAPTIAYALSQKEVFLSRLESVTRLETNSDLLTNIEYGRYHALVIGNNEYEYLPNLSSAVSDASRVAAALEADYGFEVTLLINATRSEILSTLNRFRSELKSDDNFVLYYAGHGQIYNDTGQGFWQPVDARPEDDTDWIRNSRVTETLGRFESDNVLVIADSCYSGVLLRGTEEQGVSSDLLNKDYIDRLLRSKTRLALTSGGVEPVVDTLPGTDSSVFARALLNTLEQNETIMTATDVYRSVSQDVVGSMASLGIDQTPEFAGLLSSGHEGGDFIFRRLPIN